MTDDTVTPWSTLDYPPRWVIYPCGHKGIDEGKDKHEWCELEARLSRLEEYMHSHPVELTDDPRKQGNGY